MAAPVRLQRYLASGGVAARRKAEEMITAGRVSVNGVVVRVLGTKVDPDHDSVTVDGESVVAHEFFYVLFNKPKACITAVSDDRGRPTVMDYLPNLPVPVKPVGRLDFYSEGVLLLTNDGELASRLLAPASHVAKTYHVKVHGQVTKEDIATLRGGVRLDDGSVTMPADISVLPSESKYTWLGITIHEGKHRQIHRMLEARGYSVDKLQRVAFANLTFHNLRIGDARELTQLELNELRGLVGLDHSTVARGAWRVEREKTDIPRRAKTKARVEAEDAANAPPVAVVVDDVDVDGDGDDRDDLAAYEDARGPGPTPPRTMAATTAGTREPRGGSPARSSRDARGGSATGSSAGGSRDARGSSRDARGGSARGGSAGGSRDARGSSRDARGGGARGGSAGGSRDARGGSSERSRGGSSERPRDARGFGARDTRGGSAGGEVKRAARGGSFGREPDRRSGYSGAGRGARDEARSSYRGGSSTGGPRSASDRSDRSDRAARGPGGPRGTSYGTTRPRRDDDAPKRARPAPHAGRSRSTSTSTSKPTRAPRPKR